MPGLILVNPYSGQDSLGLKEVEAAFPDHRVQECEPDDLAACTRQAISDKVDFVGVAGGDGTIRAVVDELRTTDIPLLVVPAGTRNHFAKQLGIVDLESAARAAAGGERRMVDLGSVNGLRFVNNSSIGLYPKIVVRREYHQRRLRKPIANLVAVYEQLRHGRRFSVEIDGDRFNAWMVFIGNGTYGEGLLDLTDRECLDDNVLDLRVVRADKPAARLRVLLALLFGRLVRSPLVERRLARKVRLEIARAATDVALDGEVERLKSPLDYESCASELAVLVPPGGD